MAQISLASSSGTDPDNLAFVMMAKVIVDDKHEHGLRILYHLQERGVVHLLCYL